MIIVYVSREPHDDGYFVQVRDTSGDAKADRIFHAHGVSQRVDGSVIDVELRDQNFAQLARIAANMVEQTE